jgi:hypothetical protein
LLKTASAIIIIIFAWYQHIDAANRVRLLSPAKIKCNLLFAYSLKAWATDCNVINATFNALQMLDEEGVDVIFGPSCETGELRQGSAFYME